MPITEVKLTATEVPKDVVTLLREGDFVDCMADVSSLQKVAGVFAGLAAISEALHVMVKPVHNI